MSARKMLGRLFSAAVVALGGATAAVAQTAVDSFAASQSVLSAPPGTDVTAITGNAGILGAERDVRLRHKSGPGTATAAVASGSLTWTTPAGSASEISLVWDGVDGNAFFLNPSGLATNLTASGQNAIRLRIVSSSANVGVSVRIYSGALVSSRAWILPTIASGPTPFDLILPFNTFIPQSGGADLSNAGAIELALSGSGGSVTLDSIDLVSATGTLASTLADNANSVGPGGSLNYSAVVTNSGATSAPSVRVQVPLPSSASVVAGSIEVSPVAGDDVASVVHDTTLSVVAPGVLANDADMETPPDPISVNPPGSRVTLRGGSATISAAGALTYNPPSGFVGVDRIDYLVDDGNGIPGPGSVFVDVVCAPITVTPGAFPDAAQFIAYAPLDFNASGAPTAVTFSATGLPSGLVIDPATGIVSGTPSVSGTFPVTVRATDTAGCAGLLFASLLSQPPVATPVLSIASGRYTTNRSVTLTTATAGALIHYTTNGAEPTQGDPSVASGGTVLVDRALVLKAKAFKAGLSPSAGARGDYLITGAIAVGNNFMLALKADGTVWSWGFNGNGELGLGDNTARLVPTQIPSLTGVVEIAAGNSHALARKADGTVLSWGLGTSGQLGLGDLISRNTPTAIPGASLPSPVALSAGEAHSVVLSSNGTVRAFGSNIWGQLGDGTSVQRTTPVVTQFPAAQKIAAGKLHTLALDSSGVVRAVGSNTQGELGNNTTTSTSTPVTVILPAGVTDIRAGRGQHGVARVGPRREAWVWGAHTLGQLGAGLPLTNRTVPIRVGEHVFDAAVGTQYTLFEKLDIGLYAAGNNAGYQLGLGQSAPSFSAIPLPTASVHRGVSVAAGLNFGASLSSLGSIATWGMAPSGETGHGNTNIKYVPTVITGFSLVSNGGLDADPDSDGLSSDIEFLIGTDPYGADTNLNGVDDGTEFLLGLDPLTLDSDGDGIGDAAEVTIGTNPFSTDTDGDTVLDGADLFPLDPTRSALSGTPGDVTAPVIQLTRPVNAVVIPGGGE